MTAPVTDLIAAANANIPDGWHIEAREVRRYKYRSEWRLAASLNGCERLSWKTYRVAAALPAVIDRINAEPA